MDGAAEVPEKDLSVPERRGNPLEICSTPLVRRMAGPLFEKVDQVHVDGRCALDLEYCPFDGYDL